MSHLASFSRTDTKMSANLQEMECRLVIINTSRETLGEVVAQLINVIKDQQVRSDEQRK